jgi:hypothetical protein
VLAAAGCTEENSTLVTDIGTVGFVLTDPELSSQVVNTGVPEQTIQNFVWKLTAPADLTAIDTGAKQDLLFGEPCSFVQTTKSSYNPEGRCAAGIILGSTDDTGGVSPPNDVPVKLQMTVNWMQVRRAEPEVISELGDYDADRVRNDLDNCILLPNSDQADSNEDGIGDVCSVRDVFGNSVVDNDGDGVADGSDNCVWYSNPLQEDTTGIAAEYGIPDGIGDACVEQIAFVIGVPFVLPTDDNDRFKMALATGGLSFVTVDFDNSATLKCTWGDGECDFTASAVKACGTLSSIGLALEGCP